MPIDDSAEERALAIRRMFDLTGFGFLVFLALWAVPSMVYKLDDRKGEQVVIQRFGRFVRTESDAGVNLKLPWPIESGTVVSTSEIHRLEVGFTTTSIEQEDFKDQPEHSVSITRDQNLVDAEYTVQWQVKDPAAYLFQVAQVERTVSQVAQTVMRGIVANRDVDEILVGDRNAMQNEAREEMQRILDAYQSGVQLLNVQFQDVHAPQQVVEAFNDVQRAKEDMETAQNEGRRIYNERIPVAEGDALRILAEAEAYRVRRVNEAKGDAGRFLAILAQYRTNPDLVRRQLHLEAMQEVLPRLKKTIVDDGLDLGLFLDGQAGMPGLKPAAGGGGGK